MANSKRDELVEQARALYAEGLAKTEVAAALGVSPRSIYRWSARDGREGRPWTRDEDRGRTNEAEGTPTPAAAAAPDPCDLRRRLQARLEDLVRQSEQDPENSKLEDRMVKVCRVIDYPPAPADDPGVLLRAMERFASFCVRSLPEDQMQPVRRAVRLFMDSVKEEHS